MEIQPLEVLKWVGIVLAAGFIGYFGRYLAMLIIEKLRRNKESSPPPTFAPEKAGAAESRIEESRLKLEKKRLKQEAKKAKKAKP
jgi:hypothetical protein